MMSCRVYMAVALITVWVSQISVGQQEDHGPEPSLRAKLAIKKAGFKYMKKYFRGRTEEGKSESMEPAPDNLEVAMRALQETAGFEPTGEMNEPTLRAMTWPRCGVSDIINVEVSERGKRKRRYVVSGPSLKWTVTDLTYKLKNYPDTSVSEVTTEDVEEAVTTALKLWSDVSPLTFTRVQATDPADIVLSFGKKKHTHVDGDTPFDGPGGTLAHAFYPNSGWGFLNGDLHYDDEENFTHKKYYGRNLLYVTAHEIGHALGLDHSKTRGALMWPFIASYTPNFQLPEDDILGIQTIYGPNPNPPELTPIPTTLPPPTTPMPAPAYCGMTFDDVEIIREEMFAFKGRKFWKFSLDGHLINGEEGTLIRGYFQNTPPTLHAICERWYDETILFVKAKTIRAISGQQLDQVSTRKLSDLDLPRPMEAAMHRASEGITYYFKGELVYKYDEFDRALTDDSPLTNHEAFTGIPEGTRVKAAFTGTDGNHYLLVGTRYYKVNPDLSSAGTLSNFGQDFLRCPQP